MAGSDDLAGRDVRTPACKDPGGKGRGSPPPCRMTSPPNAVSPKLTWFSDEPHSMKTRCGGVPAHTRWDPAQRKLRHPVAVVGLPCRQQPPGVTPQLLRKWWIIDQALWILPAISKPGDRSESVHGYGSPSGRLVLSTALTIASVIAMRKKSSLSESAVTVRVFTNGGSQAVTIPRKFRFSTSRATVRRHGESLMITPARDADSWDELWKNHQPLDESFHRWPTGPADKRASL